MSGPCAITSTGCLLADHPRWFVYWDAVIGYIMAHA